MTDKELQKLGRRELLQMLLEQAKDFPREAPLLIITDCECDRLNLYGRDHAFLVPRGRSLPFPPKGPVFYLE